MFETPEPDINCVAAPNHQREIPATPAFIYGWGEQNTAQPGPITQLKGLHVTAVPCVYRPDRYGHPLHWINSMWEEQDDDKQVYEVPKFLCHYPSAQAAQDGSPCFGDSGGEHLPFQTQPLCILAHKLHAFAGVGTTHTDAKKKPEHDCRLYSKILWNVFLLT